MATLLSSSGHTSLVSIDSVVAGKITVPEPARHGSWLHTDPDPVLPPKDASVRQAPVTQHGLIKKGSTRRTGRDRTNSLRHVKNSTEVLRQRSVKAQHADPASDAHPTLREGRQFTVGNVGHNGKIYLRPVIHPAPQMTTAPPQFVYPPLTPPKSASLDLQSSEDPAEDPRQSIWSGSQASGLPRRVPTGQPQHVPTASLASHSSRQSHVRAHSFSTVDDHHKASMDKKRGTFKIVIDRSEATRPRTAEQPISPTLEVPIPHYRLGTPRFSTQGTPILRSSVYTRASTSENLRSSAFVKGDYDRLFPAPPGMEARDFQPRETSQLFVQTDAMRPKAFSGVTRSSAALPSPVIRNMSMPIEPSLFDVLLPLMDDPSVVRYSQRTGEITAATPARIVAQISSDSFMDYELVSDFFLTFRSYLSTENLLALLLARLHWAINRWEPDGRIIRIRTFAALRHWILNYFMDDFVINRELRVQFCDKINAMYNEVRARVGGGTSDLKIIVDLKRCWVGRCALYWDGSEFAIDAHQDVDIVPGGIPGSRDISKTRMSQLFIQDPRGESSKNGTAVPETRRAAVETWFDGESTTARHVRQDTASTNPEGPVSPVSEQSIQAMSCSYPLRTLKRVQPLGTYRGPHPIPMQANGESLHVAASSSVPAHAFTGKRHPTHAHKRSGSFSDSIRDDRAPVPVSTAEPQPQPVLMANPYAGSLIRGNVFAPSQPFVDVLAPTSPVNELAHLNFSSPDMEHTMEGGFRPGPMATPAMKTIIGSIRRALSSKQSGSHSTSHTGESVQSAPSLRVKTSTLPLNVTYSSHALRERRAGHGLRHHMRIDLLCAEIAQSYQTALKKTANEGQHSDHGIGIALGNEREQPFPVPDFRRQSFLDAPLNSRRVPSQVTISSQSIVIVDDTGLNMPAMSGGLPPKTGEDEPDSVESQPHASEHTISVVEQSDSLAEPTVEDTNPRGSHLLAAPQPGPLHHEALLRVRASFRRSMSNFSQKRRSSSHPRRSSSLDRDQAKSTGSASTILRRYASFQSGMAKHVANDSADTTATSRSGADVPMEAMEKGPKRMLRRRPGGDLRKIQNVHDLEFPARPGSTASITTASDSLGGSVLYMAKNRAVGAPKSPSVVGDAPEEAPRNRLSLINTHSSLHVRPSFEAAVAGFSNIPDDDDGGIESTLLKLEGKYEKRSPDLSSPTLGSQDALPQEVMDAANEDKRKHHLADDETEAPPAEPEEGIVHRHLAVLPRGPSHPPLKHNSPAFKITTESIVASEDSYSSVPLLERGLSDESMKRPQPSPQSDVSVPRRLFSRNGSTSNPEPPSSHPSIELVEETDSMKKIPQGASLPERSPTARSFLLEEHENLSDLSSEMSVDVIEQSEVPKQTSISPPIVSSEMAASGPEIPSHPLAHPPTPPMTFGPGMPVDSQVNPMAYQQRPLTPDPSPTQGAGPPGFSNKQSPAVTAATRTLPRVATNSGHIPFILACDSEILAQQFTLVEKAALSEVEWRDLVDMKWNNKSAQVLNWVDYLVDVDHKGIEIVVSRFNLMVKWALSEIVMTQDVLERARVIVKHIHVAAHARKLRNYATMLQLTIALSSIDCTRLTKTWEQVPAVEKQLLKDMETLIQPVRNFHDLRVEMETANLQEGCIPFVGLYVHDLTYNAQKPAEISNSREGEALINFERYRTAATVVKSLLRLIDASTKYTFHPVQGVIERCLWVAALPDDRIQALSKSLE